MLKQVWRWIVNMMGTVCDMCFFFSKFDEPGIAIRDLKYYIEVLLTLYWSMCISHTSCKYVSNYMVS